MLAKSCFLMGIGRKLVLIDVIASIFRITTSAAIQIRMSL